jgi:hypothetical protein
MNNLIKSILKSAVYFLDQTESLAGDVRDRVSDAADRVSDIRDRAVDIYVRPLQPTRCCTGVHS